MQAHSLTTASIKAGNSGLIFWSGVSAPWERAISSKSPTSNAWVETGFVVILSTNADDGRDRVEVRRSKHRGSDGLNGQAVRLFLNVSTFTRNKRLWLLTLIALRSENSEIKIINVDAKITKPRQAVF